MKIRDAWLLTRPSSLGSFISTRSPVLSTSRGWICPKLKKRC